MGSPGNITSTVERFKCFESRIADIEDRLASLEARIDAAAAMLQPRGQDRPT